MKYLNIIILFTAGLMLSFSACDTDTLHERNLDPQAVNEIDLNFVFTTTELGIASGGSAGDNRYLDWRTNILFCAPAIQQLAVSGTGQYAAGDKYVHNEEAYHAPWRFWYTDVLKNATEILKQTEEGGYAEGQYKNMRQATRIITAFTYFRLTDFYGKIPYTEGSQGIEGTFFPHYDNQSDIYPDLLAELEDAASKISASNPDEGFSDSDFIYNGDVTKWKRWAYSLMLRYAMRASDVAPSLADEYVAKAVAGGVFQSNEDNLWVAQDDGPGEWTNQNGISRALYPGDGNQPSYMSEKLINFLKGADLNDPADDDPRLMILTGGIGLWTTSGFDPLTTDPVDQRGMPNGNDSDMLTDIYPELEDSINAKFWSRINPVMLDDGDPYRIMTYSEVELLLAEAAEKGIGGVTGAQTHYEAGVRAAMQMYEPYAANNEGVDLSVSDAEVDQYLATYEYGVYKDALEMIGEQIWVNHFMNWYEAWSEWRRTDYPALTPTNYPGNETGGEIPSRLRYPLDEVNGNPNYKTDALTPDRLTTKIWWDGGSE